MSSTSAQSSAPLGIIPEKAALAHQIRRTVPAQYWGVSVASASAPDATLASSVSDPAPLPLLAGSGLSRPHLVLATQAVKLPGRPSLPGLPSVCHDQGGLVLDRIIAHGGGDSWWAAFSGRARLGRLVAQRANLVAAAADPASYSLCGTSRVQLSRSTVLRSRLDWCPPAGTSTTSWRLLRRRRAAQRDAPPPGRAAADSDASGAGWAAPVSLSCQLHSRVGRWAEARVDLAVGHRTASGAATPGVAGTAAGGGGATTPLLMGLQAGSVASSRAPLVWRCGLLQVTAPPTVPLAGSDAAVGAAAAAASGASAGPALQSAVYAQGTVAVQGERILWQGPKRPLRRSRRAEGPATADGPGPAASAAGGSFSTSPVGGKPVAAAAPPTAPVSPQTAARPGASYPPPRHSGDGDDDEAPDDLSFAPVSAAAGAGNSPAGKALPRSGRGASAAGGGGGAAAGGGAGAGGAAAGDGGGAAASPPFGIELPSAGAVQEALADVTQSVSRLRDDMTAATQWVGGGGLVEQLETVLAAAPGAAAKRQAAPRPGLDGAAVHPWSSFVGEPHVKVAGVAGVTARAPLIVLTHGSAASGGGGASGLHPTRLAFVQDLGLKHVVRRRGRGADADASGVEAFGVEGADGTSAAASGGGGGAAVAVSRGALRPFVSAAASVQGGRFTAWLLDFTRVSAQLDCGLWGPAAARGAAPTGSARQRHPAFALGDTGAWHAMSLSLSQQIVGPLRFAADWRYELASSRPLALPPPPSAAAAPAGAAAAGAAAAGAGSWLGGAVGALAAHTVGMRPQLLEAVYALDLALPGSRGAGRLVAWYAPQRREGMLELRMF